MKKALFLLLIVTLWSCSTNPAEDELPEDGEFVSVVFQGNLDIYGEDGDYEWLDDFHEAGYNVVVGNITISGIRDTSICDLSNLGNIVEVHGSIFVSESVLIADIFTKLRKVSADLSFEDVDISSLASLALIEEAGSMAFSRISLSEGVSFSGVDTIESVDLKFLEIEGEIRFPNITQINSIDISSLTGGGFDFPKCKRVEYLNISDSDVLNLDGVNAIEEVGSFLEIRDNSNLESLESLENLEKVQRIWISENDNLESLDGLESLTEVSRFEIISNSNLVDYCAVQASVWAGLSASDYFVFSNKYTPTREELINGQCQE